MRYDSRLAKGAVSIFLAAGAIVTLAMLSGCSSVREFQANNERTYSGFGASIHFKPIPHAPK